MACGWHSVPLVAPLEVVAGLWWAFNTTVCVTLWSFDCFAFGMKSPVWHHVSLCLVCDWHLVPNVSPSEIVAGFHVEYSGMAFAVFFLAEYANIWLVCTLAALLFLGGWLSPFPFLPDSILWLFAKMAFLVFFFLWFRATFPRYRYDQIMRLGWKVFIPITIVWIVFVGGMMQTKLAYLFH